MVNDKTVSESIAFNRALKLMGNRFEITVVADNEDWANECIDAGIAEIRRIEKLLTTFSDDSETSLINKNAGIEPVAVSAETFNLIERSVRISKITQGAFDITYGSVDKHLWNFEGLTATFTNQTKGVTTYKWDFGDGTTSTDPDPVHTYAAKGKYVPTLYANTASGQTFEGSTVLRLSKGSPVKLDDNTISDWDTLNANVIVSGPKGGIFRKVKFDYDGANIYFYIEMASKKSNGDIFDFYIDADNNGGTGLLTSLFPNGGFDVLMEGAMLDNWFDVFYHTGDQNSFTFNQQSMSDYYKIGTIVEAAGILKFEGSISRTKIMGLTGKGLKIEMVATKNDWSATLGTAPDDGSPAFFLDTSE